MYVLSAGSKQAISKLSCATVSKQVILQSLSYEDDFDLHENDAVGETFSYEWFCTA